MPRKNVSDDKEKFEFLIKGFSSKILHFRDFSFLMENYFSSMIHKLMRKINPELKRVCYLLKLSI